MRIHDVTLPLWDGTPTIPGDPPFEGRRLSSVEAGDPYSVSRLTLSSHAGTHVDPPGHFEAGGTLLDGIPLTTLVGPCQVVGIPPDRRSIGLEDLPLDSGERLLFRTRNSERWARSEAFFPDYVALTGEAARELARRRPLLVGIDSLSVENDPTGHYPVHRALAGAGVVVLEGLRLGDVPPGAYELLCLPLPIARGDGAPARVLLRELPSP